jgi:hypothetical protein
LKKKFYFSIENWPISFSKLKKFLLFLIKIAQFILLLKNYKKVTYLKKVGKCFLIVLTKML